MKKIVIIGPESTGKSTLCKALAEHYHCFWVPEYARTYLEQNGPHYEYEDLKKIAEGQINLENELSELAEYNRHPYLFVDTNLYVIQIWSEYVFGKVDPAILSMHEAQTYDLYLLCNIDLPWEFDPLRELPDLNERRKVYQLYKELLEQQSIPFIEISGNSEQRMSTAVNTLEAIL